MYPRQWQRSCLSFILLLAMIFQWAPATPVYSSLVSSPTGPDSNSESAFNGPERPVTGATGLNKLSADLLAALQASPAPGTQAQIGPSAPAPLLVSALVLPGAPVKRFFKKSLLSREVAGQQWVSGQIEPDQLRKLVSVPQVLQVFSIDTFQTTEAPGLDDLRVRKPELSPQEARSILRTGGPAVLRERIQSLSPTRNVNPSPVPTLNPAAVQRMAGTTSVPNLLDIHDVRQARADGYTGTGVVVGVVDTGVDFANPDLQGAQALVQSGDYAGWPFAYDTISGLLYGLDPQNTLGPDTQDDILGWTNYVHTLPVKNPICDANLCNADLLLFSGEVNNTPMHFTWPNTSKSGQYYYSIHPDYTLSYAMYFMALNYREGYLIQPPVVVSDEKQAGVYDTVYVDTNYNYVLGDPGEQMTRQQPLGGADLDQDGVWDLSAGMLSWISDGTHQPPGVATVYPAVAQAPVPEAGRLLAFITDAGGHGTNCASEIAGQGKITDPHGRGPSNPLFAGAAEKGGVGGAVVTSIAPGAKIAAFQNGFNLPLDAWTLSVYGFDGVLNSGDEANIVSNSWGYSDLAADGWDPFSRFAQNLLYHEEGKNITFLVATGNGGHGYGTVTSPGGGPIIDVGASTAYGNLLSFEAVDPSQFLYGEVQPWSNRGPGALGDVAPDLLALGAWGTGANPLNIYYGDGQTAYDVFGGTSMSTPLAAGGMALVYQAFRAKHSRWPTWVEARSILLNGAQDLGYDIFTQGAGNMQVGNSIRIATGTAPQVTPEQWQAGNYHGVKYPAFPSVLYAGQSDQQDFLIDNPTNAPVQVNIQAQVLESVHEETFTFAFSEPSENVNIRNPFLLEEMTALIDQYQPDLVRAQVVFPYPTFDLDNDLYADNWWRVYFYDWFDRNDNHRLWNDANQNGMVDKDELDLDPLTGLSEFNRFTYGYPQATVLEASLGKAGIAQQHDGVFLGLACVYCGQSTTLQVRVSFYRNTDWKWLEVPGSLTVPALGQASVTAQMTVPAGTPPGSYEGALAVQMNGKTTLVPVTTIVAANTHTFAFAGAGDLGHPFENGRLMGGFNWAWRPEAGDWRFFYYDLPPGSAAAGKALVVDTRWNGPKTDIDTGLFGPVLDEYVKNSPQWFGSQAMQSTGGSENEYAIAGKFRWMTNTGGSRELVGQPMQDGLGMIALHNVLYDGGQLAENYAGRVFQVSNSPGKVSINSVPDSAVTPVLSGTQEMQLTSTASIDEGLQIRVFGFSEPVHRTDQTVKQNTPNNICSSVWVYPSMKQGLKISHAGVFEVSTTSQAVDLDLDLYLFQDSNGDGVFQCGRDRLKYYSMGYAADEKIKIDFPYDGVYWVVVHGYSVPKDQQPFDIHIRAIQGTDLSLRNLPLGPILADQPVAWKTVFHHLLPTDRAVRLEGVALIGPPSMPNLLEIPIYLNPSILLSPAPQLSASSLWVRSDPQPFSLSFQNIGTQAEQVRAEIDLPDGLDLLAGSLNGPGTLPTYDSSTRKLTWTGQVTGNQRVQLDFKASARAGVAPGPVTLQARVNGLTSLQNWQISALVHLHQSGVLLPSISR